MLEILKHKQLFWGLEAPLFAWVAAALLISSSLVCFIRLYRAVSGLVRQSTDAARAIKLLRRKHPPISASGLDFEAYDELSSIFEGLPLLKLAWRRYRAFRVTRRNAEGREEAWSSQSADCAFSDAAMVEPAVNLAFYTALPGIVTGAGLLCTFLAILVALLDVRLTNNRVQGLELLIQGLSGKFVSSIAALGAATLYLLGERPLLYRLTRSRHELIGELDDLVPVLSHSQVLADVSRDLSDQTVAFSTFNADLSLKLRQSFSESMGPTLERMVTAIEQLNTHLRAAEAQKQESITGSIEALVETLQRSLTETLGDMGSKFKDALSGGAMNEFQRVTDSLGGTAKLLESLNEQSKSTQLALNELVNFATKSTSDQIALGKSQVEDLTAVLRGLMTEIHQTTGSSMNAMTATLTAVVHGLASKVNDLGDKMATTVGQSASAATGAAIQVIEQANAWSAQSAQQLTQLLKEHENQLGTVRDLRLALDQSLGGFQQALAQYGGVSKDVEKLTANLSAVAASAAGSIKAMRDSQEAMQKVAALAATQIQGLSEANREQKDAWVRISQNMEQYRTIFSKVEAEASSLLTRISQGLKDYVDTSQKGMTKMVKVSDEHFANATGKLGSAVSELDDVLQGLTEAIGSLKSAATGARK